MRLVLGIALVLAGTTASAAQDAPYPFSGFFGLTDFTGGTPPAPPHEGWLPDNALALCALSFIEQREDGSYASYIADLEAFTSRGKLSYRPISRGVCTYDPATELESCTALEQYPPLTEQVTYSDRISGLTDDWVEITFFDTPEDAQAGINSPGYFYYYRCPFDAEVVAAGLSPDLTNLDLAAQDALRFPDAELLASKVTAALVAAATGALPTK